jgi:hypothetical protein
MVTSAASLELGATLEFASLDLDVSELNDDDVAQGASEMGPNFVQQITAHRAPFYC